MAESVVSDGLLDECQRVLDAQGATDRCVGLDLRDSEGQAADLRIRFKGPAWLRSAAGAELAASLLALDPVAEVERRRSDLFVNFHHGMVADLERRLAAGEAVGMETAGLLPGRPHDVSLVGPNANKALHVGHLRNVVLGQALASALRAAGAEVRTRSLVADIGRRMCEAMAGYVEGHEGQTPESLGVPGDRFVELCSRAFRAGAGYGAAGSTPGPNAQEEERRGDAAEAIMAAWLNGDPREQELCRRMRGWALAGHERTLARLGVAIDAYDFESEEIPRALALVALGLERGLFEREPGGGVVYRTGRSEYATMVLLNEAGCPTECARVLAVCHRIVEELEPGTVFLEVLGDEWRPAQTVVADLLTRLVPDHRSKAYEWLYYGLVTSEGEKIGSSNGEVVWIDDFLDELCASPAVEALERIGEGRTSRAELADLLARATFLCAPTARPLPLAPERLREEETGPAWTIAEAWARAGADPAGAGDPATAAAPAARAGVLLSQQFGPVLELCLERRDPVVLASYLLRLSQAFLAAPQPGPAARPVLRRVLESLGFQLAEAAPRTAAPHLPPPQALIEV